MKKYLVTLAMVACSFGVGRSATVPLENITEPVFQAYNIDATAFVNNSRFDIFTTLPFSTLNTLHFTNNGTMVGTPGWRLDYAGPTARKPLANFVNNGIFEGSDFGGFRVVPGDVGGNIIIGGGQASVSYVTIEATNLTSKGLLSVGTGGLLKLKGNNVNLERAGIRSGASPSGSSGSSDSIYNGGTNYINAPGIEDAYWSVGTNQALVPAREVPLNVFNRDLNTPFPKSPFHEVQTILGSSNFFSRVQVPRLINTELYSAFVNTNQVGSSNITIQVVFVATNLIGGDVQSAVRFAPGNNRGVVPVVRVGTRGFDSVLARTTTNFVYISDDMMTRSNVFLSINGDTGASARPVNYRVGTANSIDWALSNPGNSFFNYDLHIYNFQWDFRAVTNGYSAYSFLVNRDTSVNLGTLFPGLPSRGFNVGNPFAPDLNDPTNQQGRVEIESSALLNLNNTRMRAEQYLSIKTPDVLLNDQTTLDAPFISLDLASRSGVLELDSKVPETVDRISGQMYLWSATWTNRQVVFDFSDPTNIRSNTITINQHVFIVDSESVEKTVDVTVTEFSATATNLVISESMEIMRGFVARGESVVLDGDLNFRQSLTSLSSTNFPIVDDLWNFGIVRTASSTILDMDIPDGITNFRNFGAWVAASMKLRAFDFDNRGLLFAVAGPMELSGDSGTFSFGNTVGNSDISLNFRDYFGRFSSLNAGDASSTNQVGAGFPGRLYINITEVVEDGSNQPLSGGAGILNSWSVTDGFELTTVPLLGDFHGTRIISYVPMFGEVTHKWAGRDMGADTDGYFNNAALGSLVLQAGNFTLHTFETTDGNNALYVSYLDLRNFPANLVADLEDFLSIEPGMRIYFGSSNRDVNQLNGLLGGRLVYLPVPIGSTSSLTLANGQVITVSNELLYSTVIDSDVDGIANAFDSSPFDDIKVKIEMVKGAQSKAVISWMAAPRTQYELQYRDGLSDAGWQTLANVLTYSDVREWTVEDEDGSSENRYYRVIYSP